MCALEFWRCAVFEAGAYEFNPRTAHRNAPAWLGL